MMSYKSDERKVMRQSCMDAFEIDQSDNICISTKELPHRR